jgi:hypothetical protein
VKNEAVVSYMDVNPENSLLVDVVHTEEQGHDANWIACDLESVIESLQHNVSGAITGTTSTNNNAWKILKENFLGPFFHGCIS